MLVLSRKKYESITIGSDITVTVTSIDGARVHLAIDAPKALQILRKELRDDNKQDQRDTEN